MKKWMCLALCVALCLCQTVSLAEMAQVEMPVLDDEMQTIDNIMPGMQYQVLDQAAEGQGTVTMQQWMQVYRLQKVRFHSVNQKAAVTGWVVSGYVPQDLNAERLPTQPDGRMLEVQGISHEKLLLETVAKNPLTNVGFGPAEEEDMPLAQALHLALKAIEEKYGETDETLIRFYVEYGLQLGSTEGRLPYWQFDFWCPVSDLDGYEVMIRSSDGQLLYLCGPGEGNG